MAAEALQEVEKFRSGSFDLFAHSLFHINAQVLTKLWNYDALDLVI